MLHAFKDEARPARALAQALGVECALVDVHRFPDGELLPTIPQAAATTLVYRSLAQPNEKIVTLLLACEAWRRAGVRRLVLIAPYLCYLRQDAIFAEGQALSQRVIGELLGSRFDRIITVDAHLHRTATIGDVFPGISARDLCAAPALADWLRGAHPDIDLIAGPDAEAAKWVAPAAAALGVPFCVMRKQRRGDNDVALAIDRPELISGRTVALLDDVCSSGGTMVAAARLLRQCGAHKIVAAVTHALFDHNVRDQLIQAGVSHIASTDAVMHPSNAISLAPILSAALRDELSGNA